MVVAFSLTFIIASVSVFGTVNSVPEVLIVAQGLAWLASAAQVHLYFLTLWPRARTGKQVATSSELLPPDEIHSARPRRLGSAALLPLAGMGVCWLFESLTKLFGRSR